MNPKAVLDLASRLALAFPGRSIDAGHIASWAEELAELDPDLAAEVVRRLRHESKNPPSVRELLDVCYEVRLERGRARPALPHQATWTDADERAAKAASERAFREFRDWRLKHPETPAEAVALAVAEAPIREHPSDEEIARRRAEALERLQASYAEELAAQRAKDA